MAIKFKCDCGVPLIALTKQPGELMVCNNCGAEMTIPDQSNYQTGAIVTGTVPQVKTEKTPPSHGESQMSDVEVETASELQELPSVEELEETSTAPALTPTTSLTPSKPATNVTPPRTIQETLPNIKKEKPINNQMPPTAVPAPPKGNSGKNSKIKCSKCGHISQADALLCIGCGLNLKTGKTHFAPPGSTSTGGSGLNAKTLNVIFRISAAIVLLVILAILIPKIWNVVQEASGFFGDEDSTTAAQDEDSFFEEEDGEQTTSTTSRGKKYDEYSEEELDYKAIAKSPREELLMITNSKAKQLHREQHKEETCFSRVDSKARKLYPNPMGMSDFELVTFKTTRGLKQKGYYKKQLGGHNKLTIRPDQSKPDTRTFKREEVAEEDRHKFFYEDWAKKQDQYIKKNCPDYKEQLKEFNSFWFKHQIPIFVKRGFAYSRKTKQWVPIKRDILLAKRKSNIVGSKALPVVKRERLSPIDTRIPIDQASFTINPTISSPPAVEMSIRLRFPRDYKQEPLGVEIFRAGRKDGKYKLIARKDLKASGKTSCSLHFVDNFPMEEKSNNAYYKIHIFKDEIYREFSPVKVPLILPPKISKDQWTWNPIEKNGEPMDVIVYEYIPISSSKFYTFACPLQNPISRNISNLQEQAPVAIRFEPKQPLSRLKKNDFGVITLNSIYFKKAFNPRTGMSSGTTTYPIRQGDTNFFKASIIPKFSESGNHVFFYYSRSFGTQKESITINGRTFINSKIAKKNQANFRETGFFGYNGFKVKKGNKSLNLKLAGKDAAIKFDVFDRKTKKTVTKPVIKFQFPYEPPIIAVKATNKGNIISWKKIKINKDNYELLPQLVIQSGNATIYSGPIDSPKNFCVDTAIKKGVPVNYNACLSDGLIKTQAWAPGLDQKDFFTKVSNFRGATSMNSNFTQRQDYYAKSLKSSKELFSIKSEEPSEPLTFDSLMVTNPLKVGIWKPDMCHEKTGDIEFALLEKITSALLKKENILVFDRFNKNIFKEEDILSRLYGKNFEERQYGMDYIVRLRDFSRADGNGVEVWLTQIRRGNSNQFARSNPKANLDYSWRISTIYTNAGNINFDKEVTLPLLAKIKALNQTKATPAKSAKYIPENIIFNALKPIEQRSQLWQYEEISDSLLLELAEKAPDLNFLSRENWRTLISEQQALLEQGIKPNIKIGDLTLTGKMWQQKGKIYFLLFATDLKTGLMLDVLKTSTPMDKAAADIVSWLKNLSRPELLHPDKYVDNTRLTIEELRVDPFKRFYKVDEYREEEGALANYSLPSHVKSFNQNKVESFESLKAKSAARINMGKARQYHDLGLYASEIKVYQYLLAKPSTKNKAEIIKKMERAKVLAKNSSPLLKLTTRKRRKNARKTHVTFDDPVPKGAIGFSKIIHNGQKEKILHCARNQIGQEWHASGKLMTKQIHTFGIASSYKPYLNNKYGPWSKLKIMKSKGTKGELRAVIDLWQSLPVFSSKVKKMFPDVENSVDPHQDLIAYRALVDFYKHPKDKIDFLGYHNKTCLWHLKRYSYEGKELKKLRRFSLNKLFATYLYAKIDPKYKSVLNFVNNKKITLGNLNDDQEKCLIFQAFMGNKKAESTIIKYMKYNDDRDFTDEVVIYMFAIQGKEKILETILPKANAEDAKQIKWGKPEIAKSLLKKGVIKGEVLYYLVNGFSVNDATKQLLKDGSFEANNALVLLHGKPLLEIEKEYQPEEGQDHFE